MGLLTTTWRERLEEPVAPYSLAVFRVCFGLLMCWEVLRYYLGGWIENYYLKPVFLFKYYGFEWIQPWPGDGLYWHFAIIGISALLVTIGLFYRLAIWVFLLSFSYVFLLDQARYLNHFYLVCIIAFVLCFVPAQHAWSLDARRYGHNRLIPRWAVWSLLALFEILLLYAGLVKINADWLNGYPLNLWFSDRGNIPVIGPLIQGHWAIIVAAYGAIILHLLGAPLLLYRKTRLAVFMAYSVFHLTNAIVFNIGIFPWMTLAGTLMFFDPDWPVRLTRRLGIKTAGQQPLQQAATSPVWIYPLMGSFLLIQVLFPLRHYLYPGDVAWTEEGHRFAWRMKLRSKHGFAMFRIRDPESGQKWVVKPEEYLSNRQNRYLVGRPDMVLQFAHFLAHRWKTEKGLQDVEVRAAVWCSLNGKTHRLLVDPDVDLSRVRRELWPAADWILPSY